MDAGYVEVSCEEELRAMIGEPLARSVAKERTRLHELDRQWLAAARFCLVATADAEGRCDVSPKGDPAGFAHVIDDATIAIPERPGNRRVDGFRNVLANPHVGLLFVVPGRPDTLRINGRARLLRDAPFFDAMTVKGHRPTLALLVEIEQVFHHCPKAFLRSELWRPETWAPEVVVPHPEYIKGVQYVAETLDELREHYGPKYVAGMYTERPRQDRAG